MVDPSEPSVVSSLASSFCFSFFLAPPFSTATAGVSSATSSSESSVSFEVPFTAGARTGMSTPASVSQKQVLAYTVAKCVCQTSDSRTLTADFQVLDKLCHWAYSGGKHC